MLKKNGIPVSSLHYPVIRMYARDVIVGGRTFLFFPILDKVGGAV